MTEPAQHDVVLTDWPRPEVAVVRLNRPDRLNALTYELVDAITVSLHAAGATPGCRAIVITGNGRAFCAGLDLAGVADPEATQVRSVGTRMDGQERFAGMARAVRALRQPVIAAVNGPVAGAGFGLALACDIRVAAVSASFHVAAVKVGLSAGECGISYHLPRHIGTSRAFEVMLTGRPIKADEAERWGLVSRLVPDGEVVDAALEIADAIVATSPFGSRMTKQIMWKNIENDFDSAIELENRSQILATLSPDFAEATKAFLEKRAPRHADD